MDKRQTLNELLREYSETFNNTFPIRFMNISVDEAIELLQNCLEKKESYEFEFDDNDIF